MSMSKPVTASSMNSMQKLENQLCFPLYAASRMLTKAYQPYLLELGMTYPQYLVFLLLWQHEELTVKSLGELLLLDSGTLTPLLKRMEQKQWVSRRRDPRDERSVIIGLLPVGRDLQQRACYVPEKLLEKLAMSPVEFNALRLQLQQLLLRLA